MPTLNGREELHIPAGTQPGARFKLRGKGMPNVSGRGHGDLHVIAGVAVPKKLTKEQKHLLEELSKTLPRRKTNSIGSEPARSRSSSASRTSLASFPALDLRWRSGTDARARSVELLHALLDDFEPQAIHESRRRRRLAGILQDHSNSATRRTRAVRADSRRTAARARRRGRRR